MAKIKKLDKIKLSLLKKGDVKVTSIEIAGILGQEHKYILKRIRSILTGAQYAPVKYLDRKGEERPMYLLDEKDFFVFISKNKELGNKVIEQAFDKLKRIKDEFQNFKDRQIARDGNRDLNKIGAQAVYDRTGGKATADDYSWLHDTATYYGIGCMSRDILALTGDMNGIACNYLNKEAIKRRDKQLEFIIDRIRDGWNKKEIEKILAVIHKKTMYKPLSQYIDYTKIPPRKLF